MIKERCKKCGGTMKLGVAIAQTFTSSPDFPGDKHGVTMSPGGPGKLIPCLKCVVCGASKTMPAASFLESPRSRTRLK